MALAEDLEQQLCSGLRKRHVAQFINDQQLCGGEVLPQPQKAAFVARLLQLMDEACGSSEGNREAALTGSTLDETRDHDEDGIRWNAACDRRCEIEDQIFEYRGGAIGLAVKTFLDIY